jgi:hypothetical protein
VPIVVKVALAGLLCCQVVGPFSSSMCASAVSRHALASLHLFCLALSGWLCTALFQVKEKENLCNRITF